MKKRYIGIVVGIVLISAFIVLGNANRDNSGDTITIGAVLPLTGFGSAYGESQKNAIDLAVEEINNSGGIGGKNLKVVYEDDATDPKATVSATQKLINIDHVSALLGYSWDVLANSSMSTIDSSGVPAISASATPDTLENPSDFFYVTYPENASFETVYNTYLKAHQGETVATISWIGAWGQTQKNAFLKSAEKNGNKVLANSIVPLFDQNDIKAELTKIKQLNPDIIFVATSSSDAKDAIIRNSSLGINAKLLVAQNAEVTYEVGNLSAKYFENVTVYTREKADDSFINAYMQKFGIVPQNEADSIYDAVYVLKKAIELEGDTPAQIQKGLKGIRDFKGVTGVIDFTEHNYSDNKKPILEKLINGEFVRVDE